MQVIKIKKKFTFWWTTYLAKTKPEITTDGLPEAGIGRPTVVIWLLNGDYLYIGAETIKELRLISDKPQMENSNGLPDERRVGEAGSE